MMKPVFRLLPLMFAATMHAGAASGGENALPYDHVDPAALNEHALLKVREGDTGTAALLLERALLLAPHDARIRHNRDALRAALAGRRLPPLPAEDASPASGNVALPPFPLWPKQ